MPGDKFALKKELDVWRSRIYINIYTYIYILIKKVLKYIYDMYSTYNIYIYIDLFVHIFIYKTKCVFIFM